MKNVSSNVEVNFLLIFHLSIMKYDVLVQIKENIWIILEYITINEELKRNIYKGYDELIVA